MTDSESELQKWFTKMQKRYVLEDSVMQDFGEFRLKQWFNQYLFWKFKMPLMLELFSDDCKRNNNGHCVWAQEAFVFLGEKKCKELLEKMWNQKER